jgi:hypothetical protein
VWWLWHHHCGGVGVGVVDVGDHVVIVQECKWGDTVL